MHVVEELLLVLRGGSLSHEPIFSSSQQQPPNTGNHGEHIIYCHLEYPEQTLLSFLSPGKKRIPWEDQLVVEKKKTTGWLITAIFTKQKIGLYKIAIYIYIFIGFKNKSRLKKSRRPSDGCDLCPPVWRASEPLHLWKMSPKAELRHPWDTRKPLS